MNKDSGCLACGKPLIYFESEKELKCLLCGGSFSANAACEDKHFVCNDCHRKNGLKIITEYALNTDKKDPAAISAEIMANKYINMHGPEHHYLVAAALLAAWKNSGGDIELDKGLDKALQRAKNVPGGICGFWGSCGAGVGSGIFVSIITGATPLSEEEWSLANLMTSQSLKCISENGGPRCCKRNTYLAVRAAVTFANERLGAKMEAGDSIKCTFFGRNKTCKKERCLFFPQ